MRGTVACVNAGGCDKLCAFITLAVAGVADLLDGAHNAPRPVDAHVKPLEIPRRPCNLSKTQQTHRSMATEGADDRLASAAMREEERGKTWVKTSRQSTGLKILLCARPVCTVHYR